MCLYSQPAKNRKYTENNKNGGIIPAALDIRTKWIKTTCGNCIECRKKKANDWRIRLLEDIKTNKNGKMVTLTFSNESIKKLSEDYIKRKNKKTKIIEKIQIKNLYGYDKDNQLATRALHLFRELWRKHHKKSVRHWLVTELGHKGTENIHLHGIIWTDQPISEIEKIWKHGFIHKGHIKNGKLINYVNARTINYSTKYVSKIDQRNKEYKSITLCSSGIGSNYPNSYNAKRNKFNGINTDETYLTSTGHKIKIPTYWKNKLYTEEEREQLWINKLNEGITWICGEPIKTKNAKDFYKMIQWYRRKNKELGYGGLPNQNRKEFEELRRETLIQKRIDTPRDPSKIEQRGKNNNNNK